VTGAEIKAVHDRMSEQRREIRDDLEDAGVDVSSWGDDSNHTAADPDSEPAGSD
jgi:hypothetical protein